MSKGVSPILACYDTFFSFSSNSKIFMFLTFSRFSKKKLDLPPPPPKKMDPDQNINFLPAKKSINKNYKNPLPPNKIGDLKKIIDLALLSI